MNCKKKVKNPCCNFLKPKLTYSNHHPTVQTPKPVR